MVEATQANAHQLIVVFWPGSGRRKFNPNVVACKAMHGTPAGGLLKENLSLLPDMRGIE